jgi:hypothetical protein
MDSRLLIPAKQLNGKRRCMGIDIRLFFLGPQQPAGVRSSRAVLTAAAAAP